jgi:hypothetical protein
MWARRNISMVMLAVAMTAACSDLSGPDEQPNASGTWQGTLTHPSFDGGALTLTLIDGNGQISGSYKLVLSRRVGSRGYVEQSGGQVTGSSSDGRIWLSLKRSNGDEWLLEGALGRSSARGEWSSSSRINGTFDVSH